MEMFKAQVIEAGRITIPSELRHKLNIKKGDEVLIEGISKLVPTKEPNRPVEETVDSPEPTKEVP